MVFLWLKGRSDRVCPTPEGTMRIRSWSRYGQDGPVGLLGCGTKVVASLVSLVTEELWQRLPRTFAVSSIMVAPYPSPSDVDTIR